MKLKWIVWLFLCLTGFVLADSKRATLNQALNDDFENARLSRAEFLAYQLMGIQNSDKLPDQYRSMQRQVSRLGTSYMLEAADLVEKLLGAEQNLLKSALYRPDDLPLSLISPAGHFKIHYTDIGYNAAADTFIAQAAAAYDYSYDLLVNQLHFDPPPNDTVDGPEYDIYIYNLGDYGMTTPDGSAPTDDHPYGSTSFIHMDNSFQRTFTKGVDGMLVTTAHEFFHMVQIGYRNFTSTGFDSRWLFEGCAVWMEDYAFDEINDYLQYLPSYLSRLNKSFYAFNGLHEYGTGIFYMMLEQKYGPDIMRSIWQNFSNLGVFEAVDEAMRQQGSSFALELNDHMVWNYFTGTRANPELYYSEGENYPLIETNQTDSISTTLHISNSTNLLGAHYLVVEPQNFGELSVQPESEFPSNWMYALIDHAEGEAPIVSTATGSKSVLLSDITPASNVYLITTNVQMPRNTTSSDLESYAYSLTLGDIGNVTPGIQMIAPNPFQPNLHSQGAQISVRLTESTEKLVFHIASETGRVLFSEKIVFSSPKKGDFTFTWDGRTDDGELVTSGIYIVFIDTAQNIEPGKIAVVH
jgi:hypothetical protein